MAVGTLSFAALSDQLARNYDEEAITDITLPDDVVSGIEGRFLEDITDLRSIINPKCTFRRDR